MGSPAAIAQDGSGSPHLGRLASTAAALAMLLCLPARAAAPSDQEAAFAAAFSGHDDRKVERPDTPPGSRSSGLGAGPVTLDLSPEALVPLGGQRYALIVLETDRNPSHADPGAIAVAYVRRTAAGWSLERSWPEVTWSGSNGAPADAITTLDFGPAPMIVASRRDGGQGEFETIAWIISLSAEGPKLLGDIPVGGRLDPHAYPDYPISYYAYDSAIFPPTHAGAVLSVLYKGWTVPPNRTASKTPFSFGIDYRLVGGRLEPERDPHLPVPHRPGDLSYPKPGA